MPFISVAERKSYLLSRFCSELNKKAKLDQNREAFRRMASLIGASNQSREYKKLDYFSKHIML